MKKFNIGVIGAGYWGKKHISELAQLDNATLYAVSDALDQNLEWVKGNFSDVLLFKNYTELIGLDEIDGVIIATPNETHFQIGKDALLAGKHTFIEKPLCMTVKEGNELSQLADLNKRTLSVGHIYRFNNSIKKIKHLYEENFFGNLILVKFRWTNFMLVSPQRDVMFDLLPHIFDIINFITSKWPSNLKAVADSFTRETQEEYAFIIGKLGKALVNIEIGWLHPPKIRRLEIAGTKRSAIIDAVDQEIMIYENGEGTPLKVEVNNTIKSELEHFISSFNGSHPIINNASIGTNTVSVILDTISELKN